MLQLRETHLRSKYLGRAVAALVRIDNKESLRRLKEIAEGSPHEKIRRAARLGVYECTKLAVGQTAPPISGRSRDGKRLLLTSHRGQVVVLTFGKTGLDRELRGLGVTVLGVGNDLPGWPADEKYVLRYNAAERPRLFVLDKQGRIAGKDLRGKPLEALIARLK